MNKITGGQASVGTLSASGVTVGANGLTMISATFTVGVEGSNIINVAVQLKDGAGVNLTTVKVLPWYLSTVSTGLTPTSVAPQTSLAAGTNGKLIEWITDLSGLAIFTAAGALDINITDTGTPTFYLVVVLPGGGIAVSGAITFA